MHKIKLYEYEISFITGYTNGALNTVPKLLNTSEHLIYAGKPIIPIHHVINNTTISYLLWTQKQPNVLVFYYNGRKILNRNMIIKIMIEHHTYFSYYTFERLAPA